MSAKETPPESSKPFDFYGDTAPLPADPFFGIAGLYLSAVTLPALCGEFGRILPDDADTQDDEQPHD